MNLRQQFFWNVLIIFSIVNIIYGIYHVWDFDELADGFWQTYNNEQIGTDDKLQTKVFQLEEDISRRQQTEFKLAGYPTDLTNVLYLEGDFRYSRGPQSMRVETFYKDKTGNPKVVINHKNITYVVTEGDSVAGGIIQSITPALVTFIKDGSEKELPVPTSVNFEEGKK